MFCDVVRLQCKQDILSDSGSPGLHQSTGNGFSMLICSIQQMYVSVLEKMEASLGEDVDNISTE